MMGLSELNRVLADSLPPCVAQAEVRKRVGDWDQLHLIARTASGRSFTCPLPWRLSVAARSTYEMEEMFGRMLNAALNDASLLDRPAARWVKA